LFGGTVPTGTQESNLNDLWKFDPATSEWSWVSGSSTVGSNCPVLGSSPAPNCGRSGTYGTLGTPAAGNTPGGRYQAQNWVDSSGNFWLYGGLGFDGAGNWGVLSDLWRFNPSTKQWTWMGGSSTVPVTGCYGCILGQLPVTGTLGVPAQGNTPGGLWEAAIWSDKTAISGSLAELATLQTEALHCQMTSSSGGGGGVACPAILIPGTTTGNCIITVTATSGAITKTGTVTVTVQ
jgi:galactose oxidase-like protein